MMPPSARTAEILAAFSDFPLCAPDPLGEFCHRARRVLQAPIAAIWRVDFSPGQLLLERTWNLSAAEALTLWPELEGALTLDSPTILALDESPWRFRSSGAKRISTLLYLPILNSQRFLGALIVARPTGAEPFTTAEQQALRLPLQAVAFALDNERLSATAEVMAQRLELLVHSMAVPICFLDAHRKVTQPNEAFRTMLGLSDDYHGGTVMELWERVKHRVSNPAPLEARLVEALGKPPTGLTLEVALSLDDDERHYRLMTIPFLDKQGRYTGGAVVGFDLTPEYRLMSLQQDNIELLDSRVQERTRELHRANEELWLANEELRRNDQFKTDFLSNMSHELRTPLNQVMGYGSMLKDGVAGALSPEQHAFADNIMEGSHRVLQIVNAILDLTRIDAGKFTLRPTWNDYPEFLANVLEGFRPQLHAKNLDVALALSDDVAAVFFSPEEIQQVLSNLLGNAIKFTPEGGRITVRTRREGGGIVTLVEDTGIGIPLADQERIFDRFVQADTSLTRRYGGSGLGLAIVKQLVELHGGQVSVRSEPGQGACFSFWLGQPDDGLSNMGEAKKTSPLDGGTI